MENDINENKGGLGTEEPDMTEVLIPGDTEEDPEITEKARTRIDLFDFSPKRKAAAGIITAVLMVFLIRYAHLFLDEEDGSTPPGAGLLALLAVLCLVPGIAVVLKVPEIGRKLSTGISAGAFLLMPVAALCMSESVNGVFIYNYSPLVFTANYLLFLCIQCIFLFITANFRLAMIISDLVIFVFTVVAATILYFRGTPLVPVDVISIKTGLGVASGYHFTVSYGFVTGLILTVALIALSAKLPAAKFRWKGHGVIRLAALAYVGIMAFTLYGTDTAADNGLKPDFWNQVRGYHNTGTVFNFVLNTKYLIVSKPDGYNADEIPQIVADVTESSDGDGILDSAVKMYEANTAAREAAAADSADSENTYTDTADTGAKTAGDADIDITDSNNADSGDSASGEEQPALPNTGEDTPLAVTCTSTVNQPKASAKLKDGQVPDVIAVMNETLSDLRVLGGFETNQDYFPFIRSLTNNTIKGNLYMPVNGAGTSNSEFEFLTGNSLAFLTSGSNAYELYVKSKLPSLAWTLSDQGFATEAFHPYYRSSWNRDTNYPLLGLPEFTSIENLINGSVLSSYRDGSMSFYDYESAVREQYNGQEIMLRRFVSDSFDYKVVEEHYEDRDKSKPYFMLNVTMQNHGGYDVSYSNFQQQIRLITDDGEYYPAANRFLSLMYESDRAFQELVNYFSKVKTPTILVMFGDHQPSIETSFVEKVMGKDLEDLTTKEKQQRYITPFIIWANFDIPEGYVDKMSSNYLSTLLLQTAGIQGTEYNDYLNAMYQSLPVIDTTGYIASDDTYYSYDDESEYDDLLNGYRKVQYNNLFDNLKRHDEIFYYTGDDAQ